MDHAGLSVWVRTDELATISAPIDVLGVNYYNGVLVAAASSPCVITPNVSRDGTLNVSIQDCSYGSHKLLR